MNDFQGEPKLKAKYDEIIADLPGTYRKGMSLCFAGGHGIGKQLCLSTELPTPSGFIKLADLKVGQKLFDENGAVCTVTQLHPINVSPESYQITFDDGTVIDACADHLWSTWDSAARRAHQRSIKPTLGPKIRTTKELYNSVESLGKRGKNHSIPCAKPIAYPHQELPIDPYVLGCWLGDGTSGDGTLECADRGILDEIRKSGYSVVLRKSTVRDSKSASYRIGKLISYHTKNGIRQIGMLKKQLRENRLLGNKHIPAKYLCSSYEQRLSLLQGLLDTDGCCLKSGVIEFCSINKPLSLQVKELIQSLGIKCSINSNESWLYDKRCKDRYRLHLITQLPVFRLKRKLNRIRKTKTQMSRTTHRFIVDVQPISPKPMRCITVDSPSHLFLTTRAFIATHNTMSVTNIIKTASLKGYTCLYSTLSDIVAVLLSRDAEDAYAARRELMSVDFLVIDEFDTRFMQSENASDLFGRTLENVFRTRSQNRLPTFLCTNSPNIIEAFTGPIKMSLESLMKGYVKNVIVVGDDFRKTLKK